MSRKYALSMDKITLKDLSMDKIKSVGMHISKGETVE